MTARGPIAHGRPQRLPTRAASSLAKALRGARGSPPWTPWTIRSRLDQPYHRHATYAYVGGVERRDHHAGLLPPVISVITITGIGDHLQPEWLITFTGMAHDSARQPGKRQPRHGDMPGPATLPASDALAGIVTQGRSRGGWSRGRQLLISPFTDRRTARITGARRSRG